MMPQLTTFRTMTQYSLARLRVLCTTRTVWSALMVSSVLALAVIGTATAWRTRTSTEEPPVTEASFSVSPLAELMPPPTAAPVPHDAPTASNAPPVILSTATDTSTGTHSAEARDPVTNPTRREGAQPAACQQVSATQQDNARLEGERTRAQRRAIVERVARQTDASVPPSRPAPRASVPTLPHVQVVSVSSTAVLIQHDGQRQVVRRGARLNGWTLARLAPTGVTLRRAQQHVLLPLSFAARVSSNR